MNTCLAQTRCNHGRLIFSFSLDEGKDTEFPKGRPCRHNILYIRMNTLVYSLNDFWKERAKIYKCSQKHKQVFIFVHRKVEVDAEKSVNALIFWSIIYFNYYVKRDTWRLTVRDIYNLYQHISERVLACMRMSAHVNF